MKRKLTNIVDRLTGKQEGNADDATEAAADETQSTVSHPPNANASDIDTDSTDLHTMNDPAPDNPTAASDQGLPETMRDEIAAADSTISPKRKAATDSLSRLYARALFEMAAENNQTDEIAGEVEQLRDLLDSQPHLCQLLTTPALSETERRGVIDRVFHGRVSDTLYRFVQVINQKERLESLPGILQSFIQQMADQRGIVEVDVHVAQRLNDDEADDVARQIGATLGKEVVLHQYVDPSLIGGLVIRVDDELIDGSVAAQLRQMRRRMAGSGQEQAHRVIHEDQGDDGAQDIGAQGPRGQGP